MNDTVRIVRVQYSLCPNNDQTHWILFDLETTVQSYVQCLLCGPRAVVKRHAPVKRGLVSREEKDKGYALIEPEQVEGHRIAVAV
jgi:hypothetical protein